jgi:hypothetical protein
MQTKIVPFFCRNTMDCLSRFSNDETGSVYRPFPIRDKLRQKAEMETVKVSPEFEVVILSRVLTHTAPADTLIG